MALVFFIIALAVTGGSYVYNLGNGYVDPATFLSLLISLLVFVAWAAWSFVAVSVSENRKKTVTLVTALFAFCIVELILYTLWDELSGVSLLGGLGLAGGLFFGLPFVGFTKIFGGLALPRILFIIPYILLIALTWFFYHGAEKGTLPKVKEFKALKKTGKPKEEVSVENIQAEFEEFNKKSKKAVEKTKAEKTKKEEPLDFEKFLNADEREPIYVPQEAPLVNEPEKEETVEELRDKIAVEVEQLVKELETDKLNTDIPPRE